jgi:hypothetical protein
MGRRLPWICGGFYYCVLPAWVYTLLKIFLNLLRELQNGSASCQQFFRLFETAPLMVINIQWQDGSG